MLTGDDSMKVVESRSRTEDDQCRTIESMESVGEKVPRPQAVHYSSKMYAKR